MPKPRAARPLLATILELAGVATIGVGLWRLADWLALLVLGAGVAAVGYLLDPVVPRRRERP